jgi:hypothetical protein
MGWYQELQNDLTKLPEPLVKLIHEWRQFRLDANTAWSGGGSFERQAEQVSASDGMADEAAVANRAIDVWCQANPGYDEAILRKVLLTRIA